MHSIWLRKVISPSLPMPPTRELVAANLVIPISLSIAPRIFMVWRILLLNIKESMPTGLGVLGICGGGGYTLKAAESDKRFKAVATLSMFNSGLVRRNGFQDSQVATIQERLKKASDARAQEVAGGKIMYAGVATITDEEIAKTK